MTATYTEIEERWARENAVKRGLAEETAYERARRIARERKEKREKNAE